MKNEKKIKELFNGSEDTYIVVTKSGIAIEGYNGDLLAMATMIIKELRKFKGIDEEDIEKVFKLSKANEKELAEEMLKVLKEFIENM